MELPEGLYDRLVDRLLQAQLGRARANTQPVDAGESHSLLAQHLSRFLEAGLARVPGRSEERLARQVELCNAIIALVGQELRGSGDTIQWP